MLNTILDSQTKIVTLQPHGALKKEDFDNAVKIIDPFIEMHGKLNGVIIYTETFPGWEDFAAFNRHLVFIKNLKHSITKFDKDSFWYFNFYFFTCKKFPSFWRI